MQVVITSPSLDARQNVSGISSLVAVIVAHNRAAEYVHFQLGKKDAERRGPRWLLTTLTAYLRWLAVLRAGAARVIHFNLAVDPRSLVRDLPLIVLARLTRRRIVVHIHGGRSLPQLRSSRLLRSVVRWGLGGRNPTIVLSRDEQQLLQQALPNREIVVLPNCVDLDDARAFSRRHLEPGPLAILYMGRIAPGKGLDLIAEALERLRGLGRRFTFILAGAGPDEQLYAARFRRQLAGSFEFAGVVSGHQKTRLLQCCNVFLLPSAFEGLPMALLEAMAFGLVPVVTSVGSMPRAVAHEHSGLLLPERSSDEIVRALERLDDSRPLMARLSGNARASVFRQHDPAAYMTRLNDIYRYE